jgi:hypothetical protein
MVVEEDRPLTWDSRRISIPSRLRAILSLRRGVVLLLGEGCHDAVNRVQITRSDSGRRQLNYSWLMGGCLPLPFQPTAIIILRASVALATR